jgi:hypothetical protein
MCVTYAARSYGRSFNGSELAFNAVSETVLGPLQSRFACGRLAVPG